MKKILFIICTTIAVNASANNDPEIKPITEDEKKVEKQVVKAVTSPLADFNVGNNDIPNLLILAKENPYVLPEDKTCSNISNEIDNLDIMLGDDLDEIEKDDKTGLVKKGKDLAGKAAVSTIKRTVQDAIPYRNWIRKLSGAEKHEEKLTSCIEAGKSRRSFLKGYAVGSGCNLEPVISVESSVIEHQE